MKNVVFIINSIGSGGAESALFNVIEGIPKDLLPNIRIHLVLLDNEPQMKKVPQGVQLHVLNSKRSLLKSLLLSYKLLRTLRPNIVVSFLVRANMVNSMLRITRLYKASIVCERMHLSSHLRFQLSGLNAVIANFLPKILYKNNDLVLGVSQGVSQDLIDQYHVPVNISKTIYNPYNLDLLRANARLPVSLALGLPTRYMVSVGRLTDSKDQETLIKGFAQANTTLSLVIIGMGDKLSYLQKVAKNEGVEDRVFFTGYLPNPHNIISRAQFFISCSRNEGFPNALLEAMALAKPIVFTSCDSGPAEILGESYHFKAKQVYQAQYGILVPEKAVNDVAAAIELIATPETKSNYQSLSLQRAEDFTLDKIASQYWHEITRLWS